MTLLEAVKHYVRAVDEERVAMATQDEIGPTWMMARKAREDAELTLRQVASELSRIAAGAELAPPEVLSYLLKTYAHEHRETIKHSRPFVEVAVGNFPHFLNAMQVVLNAQVNRLVMPEAKRKPEDWPTMELLKYASAAQDYGDLYVASALKAFAALLQKHYPKGD